VTEPASPPVELSTSDVVAHAGRILDEVDRVVVGKRDVAHLLLVAVLTRGHVLLEDLPGVAKTLLARSMAAATGMSFRRIQFTPDLVPADVTGATVLDPSTGDFAFRPGPVFANLVLGDEINRAPPKTQAALLEAMQEHQVTADGETRQLPDPFIVVATQNPIEFEGTYPLPEAQVDRFRMRIAIGYPDDDWEVVARRLERGTDDAELRPIVDTATVLAMQAAVESVHVQPDVGRYAAAITAATRMRPGVAVGASPRGTLSLVLAARAKALLAGRDFVTPDDVRDLAVPCLAHRLILTPDQWVRGLRTEQVVDEVVAGIQAPATPDNSPP
jgi:MoxR-like ATPase